MNDSIREGKWIKVGENGIDAYIFQVISSTEILAGYYQNQTKAVKENFIWNGEKWDFKNYGPSGSYLRGPDEALVKKGPASF